MADPRLEALYVEDLLRRAAPPARRTPAGPPRRLTLSRLWRRLLGAPPA